MKIHDLKSWPVYFQPMLDGTKRFEIRRNDRNFLVGDLLWEREWNLDTKEYTGRTLLVKVDYLIDKLPDNFGLGLYGFVVMSISKVKVEVTSIQP